MTVKQISVFVENKAGSLADVTKVLSDHQIDMRALSIAETPDFGVLRAIVDDADKTAVVLQEAGYICSVTRVLAVAIPDTPGALNKILGILSEQGIDLEYTYAFISRDRDTAYMIVRVRDNDKALQVLTDNQIRVVCQKDLYQL